MSFVSVNQAEQRNALDQLYQTTPGDIPGPGFFEGALDASAAGLSRGVAKLALPVAETLDPALASVTKPIDEYLGTGLSDFFNRDLAKARQAVHQLAPDPNTTGFVGQTLNGLFDVGLRATVGTLAGGPAGGAALVAATEAPATYNELRAKGVDDKTAAVGGVTQGVLQGAGVLLPVSYGSSGLKNVLLYGPAINVIQGTINRGAMHEILKAGGYHDVADQYQWVDAKAMAADAVFGSFFGALGAHHAKLGRDPLPSDVDAALTANNHAHLELDTAPGIPADLASRQAHVNAIEKAISDLANDRPVDVEDIVREAQFVDKPTPEDIAPVIEQALKDAGREDMVTAFHGSPHDFEAFDITKIGTGEGAQAFGHGLYFSENPEVAGQYQKNLSGYIELDGKRLTGGIVDGNSSPERVAEILLAPVQSSDELARVRKEAKSFADGKASPVIERWIEEGRLELGKRGFNYKVEIPKRIVDKMLDWDSPLHKQPESVRAAVIKAAKESGDAWLRGYAKTWEEHPYSTGEEIYRSISQRLEGQDKVAFDASAESPNASELLKRAGIPGIRYLDQGSRGKGEGTRNFVLFDDKHARITEKNGEKVVKVSEGPLVSRAESPPRGERTPARPSDLSAPDKYTIDLATHAVEERPDLVVATDKGPESAAFLLHAADQEISQAKQMMAGFKAAVECFIRTGGA